MKILLISITCLLFYACGGNRQKVQVIPTIDIEEALKHFEKQPLSKYAKEIRYVTLESTENGYITSKIRGVHHIDGLIYVRDSDPFLKVFDGHSGKHLFNVGSKGRGPGELPYLAHYDINAKENLIILSWARLSNQFDLKGNFLGSHRKPTINNDSLQLNYNVATLGKNIFATGFRTFTGSQHDAVWVYNSRQEVLGKLKSYYKPLNAKSGWSPAAQGGLWQREGEDIYYYRGISDTIYRYNRADTLFNPFMAIKYGKHTPVFNSREWETPNDDEVLMVSFLTNGKSLFFLFVNKRASPEEYEDYSPLSDVPVKRMFNTLFGVYDLETDNFRFVLQSVKGIPGLGNDLDGGLPFFPKSISTDNELVDYHYADRFLELAALLPAPSEQFKKYVSTIKEDDNLIVVIAK